MATLYGIEMQFPPNPLEDGSLRCLWFCLVGLSHLDEWLAVGSEMGRLLRDIEELLSSR